MTIANKAVLVTGANRGIGKAMVEEALRRGAKRVYAGTRQRFAHSDRRVTPLTLDVTNGAQIQQDVVFVDAADYRRLKPPKSQKERLRGQHRVAKRDGCAL